jgi:hypothetical protein
MRNFILILAILFALPVFAQNHFVGVKVGVSWTNVMTKDYPLDDLSNRTGFTGSITYQYMLQKGFYLGADMLYTPKGYQVRLTFLDVNGNVIGSDAPVEFDFDYFDGSELRNYGLNLSMGVQYALKAG